MPLMYFLSASGSSGASALVDVTPVQALGLSGLGFGIVFAVLIVLMTFIVLMSKIVGGKSDKPAPQKIEKPVAKPAEAPKAVAPTAVPDGAMFVTLGGKKHTVTVEEKVPQFTVKLNGKEHAVDVEPVEEDAE